MPAHTITKSRPAAFAAGTAVLILALAACTPAPQPTTGPPSSSGQVGTGLPSSHIHGLTVSGDTSQVLLATHDGLFDVTTQPASKIGDTHDLMGFTAAKDPGVFYASGHPGEGSDLPNPLGLIKSVDGGKTWEQLSRQGVSDFHALTTTKSGIVAFDGTLWTSPDGKAWKAASTTFAPAFLAGHPDSNTVLATTPRGVQRSTDGGTTWALVKSGPVVIFAAFASPAEAVGVEPDGTVHYSADAGATWTKKGRIEGQIRSIAAVKGADGKPWIWAATVEGLVVSTDGGKTFRPADAN
ncbi:F510_1955 family glycosylhydrolase [Arthrobacter sp. ISL-65]|uniref:F510_1955 family glycosylhydrolase n=1 Tax=Arthrobacter sp. ISL-65 TaxID=2819112 RepID=UPI001BEABB53|nr:exo-alpha-sialidase [Arthrobacter sp. ISL-65]MBT2548984.1 exo-alpha-sialidase [Arthrobacter sp. ISL-65]